MRLSPRKIEPYAMSWAIGLIIFPLLGFGCSSGPAASSPVEIKNFEIAGPVRLEVNTEQLIRAKIPSGPYQVVPGDLLEFRMREILRAVSTDYPAQPNIEPIRCRVDRTGMVYLPIVGQIKVADLSLGQTELKVRDTYYPEYLVNCPTVSVEVIEYQTTKISVVGAVEEPGVYELRSDEMSLVAALMKAGGIVKEGAGVTYIFPPEGKGKVERVVLPVEGLNVPFVDVALKGGESIEVKRLDPQVFTVFGLVQKPGAFPYPPGVRYNLIQALSFAGGPNQVADPQYVKIYRQNSEGQILAAVFKIGQKDLFKSANVFIRPGDAICVEQTARTQTRQVLAGLFNIGLHGGASYSVSP